jgi:tRNA/tmRNA/rRNA uracil-C5-methylase (TrmA/RlmC/RlmD family)
MGVGRYGDNSLVVFVEGALPGARVNARVTRVHGGYVSAVVEELLQQSPDWCVYVCAYVCVCMFEYTYMEGMCQLLWRSCCNRVWIGECMCVCMYAYLFL